MEKYINYVLQSIINDVNFLEKIYNDYIYLTWIFVGIYWLIWLWLKYILLTMPIWLLFNMTISRLPRFFKLPKKEIK